MTQQSSGRKVSAQVALHPAGIPIWRDVAMAFEHQGFESGHLLADNFSIAADAGTFNRMFGVELTTLSDGSVFVETAGAERQYELPCTALPAWMQNKVKGIYFTRVPDFGPGRW